MSTSDPVIVAHPADNTKLQPPTEPQAFTIQCAECDNEFESHLPNCPGVLAIGYDNLEGAGVMVTYPSPGYQISRHENAIRALAYYSRFGPVKMVLDDGRIICFADLYE